MGVDGRCKWIVGTESTDVRLDGWHEDGLGQQRDDAGDRDNTLKIGRHREPWYICRYFS